MLKRQIGLFLVAMGFFTRIPMPAWVFTDTEKLNRASRYFGLVGTFVGIITAAVFWLAQTVLPIGVAVVLSTISGTPAASATSARARISVT